MVDINFTFVSKRATPWLQFALSLVLGWAGIAAVRMFGFGAGNEYFAALLGIMFYCVINSVVSITAPSFFKYAVPSYYLFILLVVVLLLSAKFISGISIWKLWEYRMMLISVTAFYLIASTLARVFRFLVEVVTGE